MWHNPSSNVLFQSKNIFEINYVFILCKNFHLAINFKFNIFTDHVPQILTYPLNAILPNSLAPINTHSIPLPRASRSPIKINVSHERHTVAYSCSPERPGSRGRNICNLDTATYSASDTTDSSHPGTTERERESVRGGQEDGKRARDKCFGEGGREGVGCLLACSQASRC